MGSCWSYTNGTDDKHQHAVQNRSGGSAGEIPTRSGPSSTGGSNHHTANGRAAPPPPNQQNKAPKKKQGPQMSFSHLDGGRPENFRSTVEQNESKPIVLPDVPQFHCSINGRNGWLVEEVYDMGKSCGKGTFGDVFIANHKFGEGHGRAQWKKVAIKKTAPTVLDRRGGVRIWTYQNVEDRCQEIKSLIRLKEGDPNSSSILYLYEFYWTYNHANGQGTLHMVTELLGQELDEWRHNQVNLMESSVKKIASVLLNALDYIGSRNVVHRDIKLQNILFRVNGDFRTLKLVDFGLAKTLEGNETVNDFCGSLGYIAPEIYSQKPYRFEVDMFAFGVILFRLLSGMRPFSSTNAEKLRSDTVNLRYKIEGRNWEGISPNALKLVRKLLIGQEQRFTAAQAANHEWFVERGMADSILVADYSKLQGLEDASSYSKAIALSQAPERPLAQSDGNMFYLDASVERAVKALLAERKYIGRIMDEPDGDNEGLICVEEMMPSNVQVLPKYIAQLESYTEKECRRIVREIALIIKLSHDNGMAHRNLLLTNLLVDRKGKVLLRGLQYAQAVVVDQPLTGHFGYLYSWYAFKAPEIDSEFFHDKTVDNWSLGAALYMLLTALPPFRGDGVELITNKHSGNVVFDTVVPSRSSQQLVEGLLQADPKRRLTIDQVLNSEWMIEADDVLDANDLSLAHAFMQDF